MRKITIGLLTVFALVALCVTAWAGTTNLDSLSLSGNLTVAGTTTYTGGTSYTPTTTTGTALDYDFSTLTTGTGLKLTILDAILNGGYPFAVYGGTGDTLHLGIAEGGILTFKGGATIDNATSATVLNLTETTIRATGILDVTGNSTLASVDVGGGYGSTGATVSAAGVGTFNGAVTTDGALTADSTVIGGGYGSTGATISTAGVGTFNGALTTDGQLTATSGSYGGGYGDTGSYLGADGTISADGLITGGAGLTVTGVVTGKYDAAAYYTITQADAGGVTIDGTSDGTTGFTFSDAIHTGTGYAGTGASISTAGVGQFDGAVTTGGALTADNIVCTNAATFGGGTGSTGATIATDGTVTFDGLITGGAGATVTGTTTLKYGAADYVAISVADGGTVTLNATSDGTAAFSFSDPVTAASTLTVTGALTAGVVATATNDTDTIDGTAVATYYGKRVFLTHADTVAVTLPANGAAAGTWVEFILTGDDSLAVTFSAATADTLIAPNNATADSVTFGSGHRISASVKFISNGTYWIAQSTNGVTTMTVTDAG